MAAPTEPDDPIDGGALDALLRQLTDTVTLVDRDGAILHTNRADEIAGRPAPVLLADLGDQFPIFRPDGRPYAAADWPLRRSVRTGEVIVGEEFFRTAPDGSRRTFICNSAPFHDAQGRIVGGVLVARDITERKHAEALLAYHESLLDNVEDGIVGTDAEDFRVTAWNRGAEQLYGYTADEVLGRPAREVASYPGDDSRARLERQLLDTGRTRIEFTARRKDGTEVDVELVAAAVADERGKTSSYLGIHRDITERKQSGAQLETGARQQTLLADLSLRALGGDPLQSLLDHAVVTVAEVLHMPLSSIAELDPQARHLTWCAATGWTKEMIAQAAPSAGGTGSLVGYTVMVGMPVVSEDVAADPRFAISALFAARAPVSAAAVVIPGPSTPFGVLTVAAQVHHRFEPDEIKFMQAVASVIGIAVERGEMEARLEAAREMERTRVARELHDDGLRELTEALGIASVGAAGSLGEGDEQRWAALTAALQRVGQQLRSAIYDLRLGTHEDRGFGGLLEDLVAVQAGLGLGCEIRLDGAASAPAGVLGHRGTEALRIVREAMTNARRHSGGVTIWVDVGASTSDCLRLSISDDGDWPGREAAVASRRGTGLLGMEERASAIGASLGIEGLPGGGTVVTLALPLTVGARAPWAGSDGS